MKRLLNFGLTVIAFLMLGLTSCEKDSDKEDSEPVDNTLILSNTPEALVKHNVKSGGVYKGIVVGSSGTIKIILQDESICAEVSFDGESRKFTTSLLNNWTSGEAISGVVFSSENWELKFSVEANGNNPSVILSIPNHSTLVTVMKETSTELVKAYEGTYTGDASGIWNCVVKGESMSGIRKWNEDDKTIIISGSVNENIITGTGFNCVLLDNTISGTWSQEAIEGVVDALKGTVSGVRKL